jgi:thioredoxin reductase (NADPH)
MADPKGYAVSPDAVAVLHGRFDETFPALTTAETERLRRFGTAQRFAAGEALFEAGKPRLGMFVILSGHVTVTARDGLGKRVPVVELGPGQFIAELGTLNDQGLSIADGHADGDVETLLIRPPELRAMIVEESDVGERVMRALVLRRFALVELGEGGTIMIGDPSSRGVARLEHFLRRNGLPHRLLDPAVDPTAKEVAERLAFRAELLPIVVCPNGEILQNPTEAALAHSLGLLSEQLVRSLYDVAIVGSGPAGLSTAVYAASEGLSVIVFDAHAFGGQAGASSRIENYLGFPTGISGLALAARAYAQARKFGAEIAIPVEVKSVTPRAEGDYFELRLDDGRRIRGRSVVVATGAHYRRPAIDNLGAFEGHGVWYWSAAFEAKLCAGREVIVVGGGNSAGQAAVYLAGHTAKVRMMVRGSGVAASMSRYLVQRIAATPNIEVMTQTVLVALEGSAERGLERVRWRSLRDNVETEAPINNVFLFLGATPATGWLADSGVALDRNGFVLTGGAGSPLASSIPGLFAVGDVRAGSVKRVGSAIGEGAQVVLAVHEFLERESARQPQATAIAGHAAVP